MSKFSPGPWYWHKPEQFDFSYLKSPPVGCILEATAGTPTAADARLIAAAPQMYALLRDWLDRWPGPGDFSTERETHALLKQIDGES